MTDIDRIIVDLIAIRTCMAGFPDISQDVVSVGAHATECTSNGREFATNTTTHAAGTGPGLFRGGLYKLYDLLWMNRS